MRCINCGYENLDGLKYCSSCGQELLTIEQKDQREKQKRSSSAMKITITIAIIALVICGVVFYIIDNNNKKEREANKHVDPILVGIWDCKNSKDATNYSTEITLNGDATYVWAEYGKAELNYLKGSYETKDIGTFAEDSTYELYSLELENHYKGTNGVEAKEEKKINYNMALSPEKTNSIIASGEIGVANIYCNKRNAR